MVKNNPCLPKRVLTPKFNVSRFFCETDCLVTQCPNDDAISEEDETTISRGFEQIRAPRWAALCHNPAVGQSAELALKPRLAIYSRTRFFRTRHTTLLNINKHRIKLEINHYIVTQNVLQYRT